MKSIFEIENRLDIQVEFKKFIKVFHKLNVICKSYNYAYTSLFKYIDSHVFKKWKYRDTMLSTDEFLIHIGISPKILTGEEKITEEIFLRYIEFILNMVTSSSIMYDSIREEILDSTLDNIPIILEKMNYKSENIEDRIILTKRNSDVDSIISKVPKDISVILLEYNDFRIEKDISVKREILKQLDLYIEENIKLKSFDTNLSNCIGMIVNKMGVNHPLNEEPFASFTEETLIDWYDKCFLMMIHAIRIPKIKEIQEERKKLLNPN